MNTEKTATELAQITFDKQLCKLKQEQFWKYPGTLPEALAKHYCSFAHVALQLGQLIKLKRVSDYPENLDYLIREITKTILEAHRRDLGSEICERNPQYADL